MRNISRVQPFIDKNLLTYPVKFRIIMVVINLKMLHDENMLIYLEDEFQLWQEIYSTLE